MKGILLAAGKGKRLGLATPKCLQLIGDKTILQRQLAALSAQGVRDIVCVVGYQKEVVMEAVQKMWPHTVTFVENGEFDTTNTSYSLYLAQEHMHDDFFYMNADVAFRPDLLDRLVIAAGDAALAIQHKKCGAEEVKVVVNGSRIVRIGKDLEPSQCPGEFVGVALFRKSMNSRFIEALSRMISDGHKTDYFEGALQRITGDTVMTAVDITDIPCIEIDFPDDLHTAAKNAAGFDGPSHKKSFNEIIKQARTIAQAPRIAEGENWYTEYFMRYFTIYISYFCWRLGISANAVTALLGVVCLLGSVVFVFKGIFFVVLGWSLWMFAEVLDCVDGEVARLSNKASKVGSYIDKLIHIFENPLIPLACGLHIFLLKPTSANAVCTFILYSSYYWNNSLADIQQKKQLSPVANNVKGIKGDFGSLRFFAGVIFTLFGQMLIFPLVLILHYTVNGNFISPFLQVYTLLVVCVMILRILRETTSYYKADVLKNNTR